MQKLNNAGQILPNDWQVLPKDAAFDPEQLAVGKWLIPIKLYNANRTELSAKTNVSVWLDSDDEAAETAMTTLGCFLSASRTSSDDTTRVFGTLAKSR